MRAGAGAMPLLERARHAHMHVERVLVGAQDASKRWAEGSTRAGVPTKSCTSNAWPYRLASSFRIFGLARLAALAFAKAKSLNA